MADTEAFFCVLRHMILHWKQEGLVVIPNTMA
jgi:hypothetical protein